MNRHIRPLIPASLIVLSGLVCVQTPGGQQGEPSGGSIEAVIQSIEGEVTARINPSEEHHSAEVGARLVAGDALRTGADSWGVLELFENTVMVVAPNSELEIDTLEGDAQSPLVRLTLAAGEVFNVRADSLPEGATYEVSTPAGVMGIRGTGMSASHDPATDSGEGTCLFGNCSAAAGGSAVNLTGNQYVGLSVSQGIVGQPTPLTQAQLDRWSQALEKAQAAGYGGVANAVCGCLNGADLVCHDGTTITNFPACANGILSPAPTPAATFTPTPDTRILNVTAWTGTISASSVLDEPDVSTSEFYRYEELGGMTTQGSVRYELMSPGQWAGTQGDLEWVDHTEYNIYNIEADGSLTNSMISVAEGTAALTLDPGLSTITVDLESGTYDLAFIPADLGALTIVESKTVFVQGTPYDNTLTYGLSEYAPDPNNPCADSTYPGVCARATDLPLPDFGQPLEGSMTLPDGGQLTWSLTAEGG